MDGVVATETANNATIGGTMIPLLSLGIPGDGTTALLLGALMVHGLTPGPLLMKTHPEFLYVIFASMIVASVMTVIIEYFGLKIFVKLLNIPKYFLLPTVFVFCVVGAFTVNNRIFDMFSLLIFGCIGIILRRCGYPHAPCILGFILGRLVETYLRTGLMMTRGNFWQFFTSPVAAVMMSLTVLLFAYQCLRNIGKWNLSRKGIVQEKKLPRIEEDD
jgi:putative tricarboxylic transport membrane protein